MTRLHMAAVAVVSTCAFMLVGAGVASAQETTVPMTKKVAVTGTNKGKDFTGTYTIQRFVQSGDKMVAVGTLRGKLRNNESVTRKNVRMPATLAQPAQSAQIPPLPNACTILNLTLGPINLNLLGLVVRTNRIDLRIDAQRGPGNLLGNLLCAITGLLDQSALTGAINNLVAALNAILALLPTGPATAAAAVSGSR